MRPDPRAWAVLRLEMASREDRHERRFFDPHDRHHRRLRYYDSTGDSFEQPVQPGHYDEPVVPSELRDRIKALAETLPDISGPHVEGPARLPVFLDMLSDTRPSASLLELIAFVEGLGPVWPVRLGSRGDWARRAPFRLPFRVATLGGAEPAAEALRRTHWIEELGEREPYVLVLDEVSRSDLRSHLLYERAPDILIGETADVRTALAAVYATEDEEQRPRLIVALDRHFGETFPEAIGLPPGCSLLVLPDGMRPTSMLAELFGALVHDLPLHDAVAEIARRTDLGPLQLPLVSDPYADHALRISDAQGMLMREVFELEPLITLRHSASFLDRIGPDAAVIGSRLTRAAEVSERIGAAADAIRFSPPVQFGRESLGLHPLARAELMMSLASHDRAHIEQILMGLTSDPEAADVLRRHQRRRVDVALASSTLDRLLPRGMVLAGGSEYRLLARVGATFSESLFEGPPPEIDPLLPDPPDERGHELEIVLYPIDFVLASPNVERVRLPRFGGSDIAHFWIEAPPAEGGREAYARLAVYHENHLVQSFMLRAVVAEEEHWTGDGLRVELEFSRTRRFENIDELGSRAVSLTVNETPAGTHRLTIKRDGTAQDFSFSDDLLAIDIKNFRDTLEEATEVKPKVPRFPDEPVTGDKRREAEGYIRKLAREGGKVYDELTIRSDGAFFEALNWLACKRDETIQIVRVEPNYALPWAAFYDFELPERADAPVCLGIDDADAPCAHEGRVRLDCYCVYGFWGVRHRIEQFLIPWHRDASSQLTLKSDKNHPPTVVAFGVQDPNMNALLRALERIQPGFAEPVPANTDVLDRVWPAATRPTCFVVVGHLESGANEPRIALPAKRFFDGAAITRRTRLDGRLDGRPLVLLMACGSGATQLATHAGLSLAVYSAGAAAVVSTEATVFTTLVKRFVDELMTSLWSGHTIGEAMTEFRRRRLAVANPLAFAFTAFGDADLKVEH